MDNNKDFDLLKLMMVWFFGGVLLLVGLSLGDELTAPNTSFKVTSNEITYYANGYKIVGAFIELDDYYTHRGFITQHYTQPLILQGQIQIKSN